MAAGYRKRADVQQKELLKGLRESPKGATGGCPVVSSFFGPAQVSAGLGSKFPLDWKSGVLRAKFPEFPVSTPLQTPKFPEISQFPHLSRPPNFQKEILEIYAWAKLGCRSDNYGCRITSNSKLGGVITSNLHCNYLTSVITLHAPTHSRASQWMGGGKAADSSGRCCGLAGSRCT